MPIQHASYLVWESPQVFLHLPLDKMAAILQKIFWDPFSWKKMFVFGLKYHWSLFLRIRLTTTQHWFWKWLGAEEATSHYLTQCWPNSLMHICSTKGRWVNCLTTGYIFFQYLILICNVIPYECNISLSNYCVYWWPGAFAPKHQ